MEWREISALPLQLSLSGETPSSNLSTKEKPDFRFAVAFWRCQNKWSALKCKFFVFLVAFCFLLWFVWIAVCRFHSLVVGVAGKLGGAWRKRGRPNADCCNLKIQKYIKKKSDFSAMHNQFEFLFIYFTRFSFAIPCAVLFSLIVSCFILFVISLCGIPILFSASASALAAAFAFAFFCRVVVLAAHKVIYFTWTHFRIRLLFFASDLTAEEFQIKFKKTRKTNKRFLTAWKHFVLLVVFFCCIFFILLFWVSCSLSYTFLSIHFGFLGLLFCAFLNRKN